MPAHIPHTLRDVAEILGTGTALELMQLYGGQDVLFAHTPKPELIAAFGAKRAAQITELMAGQKIYVPNGKAANLLDEVRRLQIAGHDQQTISRELGISTRHVRRIARALPAPAPALPLFPDLDR